MITEPSPGLNERGVGAITFFILKITVHIGMGWESTEITRDAILYSTIRNRCLQLFDV